MLLVLFRDFFINHYIYKDPYQTTRIQWRVSKGFLHGSPENPTGFGGVTGKPLGFVREP